MEAKNGERKDAAKQCRVDRNKLSRTTPVAASLFTQADHSSAACGDKGRTGGPWVTDVAMPHASSPGRPASEQVPSRHVIPDDSERLLANAPPASGPTTPAMTIPTSRQARTTTSRATLSGASLVLEDCSPARASTCCPLRPSSSTVREVPMCSVCLDDLAHPGKWWRGRRS